MALLSSPCNAPPPKTRRIRRRGWRSAIAPGPSPSTGTVISDSARHSGLGLGLRVGLLAHNQSRHSERSSESPLLLGTPRLRGEDCSRLGLQSVYSSREPTLAR